MISETSKLFIKYYWKYYFDKVLYAFKMMPLKFYLVNEDGLKFQRQRIEYLFAVADVP